MGRPRKRARDDNSANDEVDFNDVGELPPFTFDMIPQQPIVGIPGTGIPLSMSEHMQNVNFETSHDPSLQWIDPTLQNYGIAQPGDNFRPMLPWIGGSDQLPDVNGTPSSAYPTPPQTNGANGTSCTCLPNLYVTLSDLGTTKEWSFPMSVHKLKTAMQTSDAVLKCQICPYESTTAMQNLMLLTTLLTTVTDCYRKILKSIDVQAAKAEESGDTIQYRMGDSNPEKWHLHTGTNDCPMGINVDLDASEYKMLARKVIRADVHGAKNSPMGQISVVGLVDRLEQRQQEWHKGASSAEMREHYSGGGQQCNPENGDFTCLKLVGMVRHQVGMLEL